LTPVIEEDAAEVIMDGDEASVAREATSAAPDQPTDTDLTTVKQVDTDPEAGTTSSSAVSEDCPTETPIRAPRPRRERRLPARYRD
jgi:hypothetical protein